MRVPGLLVLFFTTNLAYTLYDGIFNQTQSRKPRFVHHFPHIFSSPAFSQSFRLPPLVTT